MSEVPSQPAPTPLPTREPTDAHPREDDSEDEDLDLALALSMSLGSTPSREETTPPTQKKKSKSKKLCAFEDCKKKLGLLGITCRCGHTFCSKHRHDRDHHCTYDYRQNGQDHLKSQLIECRGQKLDKI